MAAACLALELFAPERLQNVILSAPIVRSVPPFALEPAGPFQPAECRKQRSRIHLEDAFTDLLDTHADTISMHRLQLQCFQDQHVQRALNQPARLVHHEMCSSRLSRGRSIGAVRFAGFHAIPFVPRYDLRVPDGVKRIGLISDTHGLLRKEAVEALRGSELIIHAGDVGKPEILDELRSIAQVVVVRGNVDTESWAQGLPETAVAETGAAMIYVLHNVNTLDLNPAAAGFQIVVSGHSHKPGKTEREGVLYVNPGSAGPRRFQLPVTVAHLRLGEIPYDVEFVDLEPSR